MAFARGSRGATMADPLCSSAATLGPVLPLHNRPLLLSHKCLRSFVGYPDGNPGKRRLLSMVCSRSSTMREL
jgi:hypothetical protein